MCVYWGFSYLRLPPPPLEKFSGSAPVKDQFFLITTCIFCCGGLQMNSFLYICISLVKFKPVFPNVVCLKRNTQDRSRVIDWLVSTPCWQYFVRITITIHTKKDSLCSVDIQIKKKPLRLLSYVDVA